MKNHSDRELHHYGEMFTQRGYAKYMTFVQFMAAPAHHQQRIERGTTLPLSAAKKPKAPSPRGATMGGSFHEFYSF